MDKLIVELARSINNPTKVVMSRDNYKKLCEEFTPNCSRPTIPLPLQLSKIVVEHGVQLDIEVIDGDNILTVV